MALDESTRGLDPERQRPTLLLGRTTIIIADRLSTVRRADRPMALDRGRVAW